MSVSERFELSGKVAVLSGASRGIGLAAATTLAQAGAHVVLASRKPEALEDAARQIRDADGEATPIACHNGDLAQVAALFEQVQSKFGRCDILVNNAATNPHYGSVLEVDEKIWDKTVDVNLKGYFFMSQHAARLMKVNGSGSIINVASVNAIRPISGQVVYSLTKAAICSMTQGFAKELGPSGIRVNSLLPGITDTKFASALVQNEQFMEQVVPQIPLRRAAQPDEMSGMILYLASDASSYTTGASFVVDGGILA